jgi:hypothetical protein
VPDTKRYYFTDYQYDYSIVMNRYPILLFESILDKFKYLLEFIS